MIIQYEYIGRTILGGGVDEENSRYCLFEEIYRLNSINDLTTFIGFLPSSGRLVQRWPSFRIKTCTLERISDPRADGKVDIVVKYKCSTRVDIEETDQNDMPLTETTPPWENRLEDFLITTIPQKETATGFWPYNSDIQQVFCNSAGVPFEGSITRGLSRISFSYNLEMIDLNVTWSHVFKVNKNTIQVAGMVFPKRTLMIQNIDIKRRREYNNDGSLLWSYFKIIITLLADPGSFDRQYANVGYHVRTSQGLCRLWCWNNGATFGTYTNYIASGAADGEEVTEKMYLTVTGMNVSPFINDGRQVPVYQTGSLYEPVDFEFLKLPKVL